MFLHPYKAKIVQHFLRVHRHPSLASPSALGQVLKLLCQRLYKLLNTTTASIVNGTSKISSLSRDQVRFHTPRVVWAINCLCRSSGHHILPVLVSPWIPRSDHNRFQTLQSSAKEIACKYTESLQEPAPTHTKKRVCRRCYATKQNRQYALEPWYMQRNIPRWDWGKWSDPQEHLFLSEGQLLGPLSYL